MSAVYFVTEGDRGCAVWRASEEAADVFLCAVALDVYDSESEVREHFAKLVDAVAAHYRRGSVAEAVKPASRLAGFPCETCTTPEADDVRHHVAQLADASELALSPGGLPIGCCRIKTVGAYAGRPSTSQLTTR